ncbi:MAG: metallophosphoesterase family protein [Aggregatilineales bacterium]
MRAAYVTFLPPDVPAKSVQACLGLISDTHMPQRCAALPGALTDVFCDVDLILHAGDVGELWVLDQLSAIAPVVAVHGNDETADAQRELPYQQMIVVGGQRILLCHTHHPDRAAEMELRKDDTWQPKLARWQNFARKAGASVLVFGHTHIPITYQQDGILLVNPGAIASGSAITRQTRTTVALLFILTDHTPVVVHFDLNASHRPYTADVHWDAGFRTALNQYSASILDPALKAIWPSYEARVLKLLNDPADKPVFDALYAALLTIARPCWIDDQRYINRADLLTALDEAASGANVPQSRINELRSLLD